MFCLPFMVHTGSDMLLYWKIKKHNDYANVVFPNACANVSVCKFNKGEKRTIKHALCLLEGTC